MTVLATVGERSPPNPVIEVGYDLVEAYRDELIVRHVVPREKFDKHLRRSEGSTSSRTTLCARRRVARLGSRGRRSTLDDCDWKRISTEGRVGKPVDEVLSATREADARYIVISGQRRSSTGKAISGASPSRFY